MEKKNRIFIKTPGSDNVWLYCGGPDLQEVVTAIGHQIEMDVYCLLRDNEEDTIDIELKVSQMTDEEVENLQEV